MDKSVGQARWLDRTGFRGSRYLSGDRLSPRLTCVMDQYAGGSCRQTTPRPRAWRGKIVAILLRHCG